jgi:hypothetical protein
VQLQDKLAYVGVGPRLTIWDLHDPAAPRLRGQTEPFDGLVSALAIAGKYAYLGAGQAILVDGRLHVVDISDPDHPRVVATMPIDASKSMVVVGQQLLVAHANDMAGSLSVFDISDPVAPKSVRTLKGGSDQMRVVGDRLYYWGVP